MARQYRGQKSNYKNLETDSQLDKHLKCVKVGEAKTSLELATEDNGARISGDLEVTGYTDNIKLRSEAIIKADGNVTLYSAGDITLDADDGQIFLKDGGAEFAGWSTAGSKTSLTLYESGGTSFDDYLAITVVAEGATSIATVDGSGTDADLLIKADGDITLDSATGVFEMKGAGTVPKFADMYAGMILGYTAIGIDAARDSVNPPASMAVTDADHKVTFIAPPSGKVEIEIGISVISIAVRWLEFGLSNTVIYSPIDIPNTNDVTNEHRIGDIPIATYAKPLIHKWVVEGLTAGTEYIWWLGAKTEQAGRVTLWWGGSVTSEYPPFTMKATALPATIYTG